MAVYNSIMVVGDRIPDEDISAITTAVNGTGQIAHTFNGHWIPGGPLHHLDLEETNTSGVIIAPKSGHLSEVGDSRDLALSEIAAKASDLGIPTLFLVRAGLELTDPDQTTMVSAETYETPEQLRSGVNHWLTPKSQNKPDRVAEDAASHSAAEEAA